MASLDNIRRLAAANGSDAAFFADMLRALENGMPLELSRLYELDYTHFQLAVEALRAWRLQRWQVCAEPLAAAA